MESKFNNYSGFIKIHRSILDEFFFRKPDHLQLWLFLNLKACYKPYQTLFSGKPIILSPGQLLTGRKKISLETGIQESKVERIIKQFVVAKIIEQQTFNTSRLITILNWEQSQLNEQQVNNKRTTNEQQVNTIQESKEEKEGKEIEAVLVFPSIEFEWEWNKLKEYRKNQHRFAYKKKTTEQLAIDATWKDAGKDIEEVKNAINTAIKNGWKGVFPKKEKLSMQKDTATKKTKEEFLA